MFPSYPRLLLFLVYPRALAFGSLNIRFLYTSPVRAHLISISGASNWSQRLQIALISSAFNFFLPLPRPLQLFFFCLKEPADGCGGETTLVENRELLSRLEPEVLRKFEEREVRYVRYLPDKSNKKYLNWQHVYNTDDREVSRCTFSCSPPVRSQRPKMVLFIRPVN